MKNTATLTWKTERPTKTGNYLMAFINTVRREKYICHAVLSTAPDPEDVPVWHCPQDQSGGYGYLPQGGHIQIIGFAAFPAFPKLD